MATPKLERLLAAGYFPEVLPPCFHTESFGNAFAPGQTPPSEFELDPTGTVPKQSKCVRYNQARVRGYRREFAIPNPVHFFRLVKCFRANWSAIEPLAQVSPISLTKPLISHGRHCFRPTIDFKGRPAERARVRATARYILRTDIARFFPSVYTHSIAWALHGKAAAKRDRSHRLFGNELDTHFRNLQDKQSVGIPIGQDISRVIAEVILGQVERSLDQGNFPNGLRCIDDYELGFLTRGEAETFRHMLERALGKFELALNPLKTRLLSLPQLLLDRWDSELRNFDFGEGPLESRHLDEVEIDPEIEADTSDGFRTAPDPERLLLFLNKAIALQLEFPDEAVLRFSLVRLAHLRMTTECWGLLQNYLFQCALNQPETLRVVVSNLLRARFLDGQTVDRIRLKHTLNTVVETAAPLGHSSDVAWALWTMLIFRCRLSRAAANELKHLQDSVGSCLACELNERGLWPGKFDLPELRAALLVPGSLYDDQWLIAYEAARRGWLGRSSRDLSTDPCFKYLDSSDVSFFVPGTAAEVKRRLKAAMKRKRAPDLDDSDDESDSEDAYDLWWLRNDAD